MENHNNIDLSMIKVPLLYVCTLLVSITNVEEGLRLSGLALSVGYTLYKFISDYRKNKKNKNEN